MIDSTSESKLSNLIKKINKHGVEEQVKIIDRSINRSKGDSQFQVMQNHQATLFRELIGIVLKLKKKYSLNSIKHKLISLGMKEKVVDHIFDVIDEPPSLEKDLTLLKGLDAHIFNKTLSLVLPRCAESILDEQAIEKMQKTHRIRANVLESAARATYCLFQDLVLFKASPTTIEKQLADLGLPREKVSRITKHLADHIGKFREQYTILLLNEILGRLSAMKSATIKIQKKLNNSSYIS